MIIGILIWFSFTVLTVIFVSIGSIVSWIIIFGLLGIFNPEFRNEFLSEKWICFFELSYNSTDLRSIDQICKF